MLALVTPALLGAAALPVAGDGEHLWIVQQAPDDERGPRWVVRHRAAADPPDTLSFAATFRTPIRPEAIAATARTLWLVDGDGGVHLLRAERGERRREWDYSRRRGPRLPPDTELRAFDAGEAGTFALVRVSSAARLRAIDEPAADAHPFADTERQQQLLRWLILGLPPEGMLDETLELEDAPELMPDAPPMPPGPVTRAPPEDTAAPEPQREREAETDADTGTDTDTGTDVDEPVEVDRLLQFGGGRWRKVALPDDWPEGATAQLVAPPATGRPLRLLAHDPHQARTLRTYEWHGPDTPWQRHDYTLEIDAAGPVTPLILDGQLVVAQPIRADEQQVSVHLLVLRRGRTQPVGTLTIEAQQPHAWGIVPVGATAALVVETGQHTTTRRGIELRELWWARMNLHGMLEAEPARLEERDRPAIEVGEYIMLVAIVMLGTIMVLTIWRRTRALRRPPP